MSFYIPWIVFGAVVATVFIVDFFFVNRTPHHISIRESLLMTAAIVAVALLFGGYVYLIRGPEAMSLFFTGYLIEYALSVDNLFVFIVLFSLFKVPPLYRHRVLFWGILFAIVTRGAFIFCGIAIVSRFHWMLYLLGAFLIYTGIKLFFHREQDDAASIMDSWLFRSVRRVVPCTRDIASKSFFVRDGARRCATPLFMCLLAIEITDILFAIDSVPAIIVVSRDPFIVFTSNLFAVLGLRSLYFALSGAMVLFRFLNYGLAVILVFIGGKILLEGVWEMPTTISLAVVGAVLAICVAASLLFPASRNGEKEE